ncbi:MAG TPA: glycosyltransferase, partial [Gammaproteobacteria bacterium]|nr:glycosyltransferase [Gammaproteobacteria bacterium]
MLKLSLKYFLDTLKDIGDPYEIIVSDSGTQAATRDVAQGFSEIIYLPEEKNVGYAKIVNRGIQRAHGDYIFIANADIILS